MMITLVEGNKWDTESSENLNYFNRGDSYTDVLILCDFTELRFMRFSLLMLYIKKKGFKNIDINTRIDINTIHLFRPKHTLFAQDALQVTEVKFIANVYWQCFLGALHVSSLLNVTESMLQIKRMKLRKLKGHFQAITTGLCGNEVLDKDLAHSKAWGFLPSWLTDFLTKTFLIVFILSKPGELWYQTVVHC